MTDEDRIELGIQQGMADARHDIEAPLLKRIVDLQAKLEASRDCSGRYHKRIAKLEAENARLQQFLDRLLTACMFADEGDHLPLQDARKAGERILAEHRRATS